MSGSINTDSTYITGLASEYPRHSYSQQQFEEVIKQLCPEYTTSPGLQKLIQFNRRTNMMSRPTIHNYNQLIKEGAKPPTIDELSRIFRTDGVNLTASACRKAMQEARLSASDITHVVAVTCTDQGNPGYDLFVSQKLQLQPDVQRVLLHGVGCAGGLSALRAAANLAAAASQRGRPARILVFACELCSLFLKAELQAACRDGEELHIGPALFSDAAAALVVCNGLGLAVGEKKRPPIFELLEWESRVVPGTAEYISYVAEANGMIANIAKDVPKAIVGAIPPMFDQLRDEASRSYKPSPLTDLDPEHFDWALHPGGAAIMEGARRALHLTDDHIRASLDVYRSHGNSSSPTVLIVLDQLRRMGEGRDHVVATSFGPGLMIEMFMMRRCRVADGAQPLGPGERGITKLHQSFRPTAKVVPQCSGSSGLSLRQRSQVYKSWRTLQSRLTRLGKGSWW